MTFNHFDQLLGQRLLQNKQIDPENLDRALAIQREQPETALGEILIRMSVLTQEALTLAFLQLYAQVNANDFRRIRWARGVGRAKLPPGTVRPTA